MSARSRKWHKNNKALAKERNKRYFSKLSPEELADRHFRYRYGMTIVEYEEMLVTQEGNCALCKKPLGDPPKGKRRHLIDHFHSNGNRKCDRKDVRGIVHGRCNTFVGLVENYPEILDNVVDYLERTAIKNTSVSVKRV